MAGALAFAEKYRKNGKLEIVYRSVDAKETFAIWDLESVEEIMRLYAEYPLTPYVENKDIPVVEGQAATKIRQEVIAAAKKAAKK
jgi:muconolactone delta-isomerase